MTASCSESPSPTPPPSTDGDTHSIKIMAFVDRLTPPMRALVHEFGVQIVHDMFVDGHRDAEKLRAELEPWRDKRQDQWFSEIPYRR